MDSGSAEAVYLLDCLNCRVADAQRSAVRLLETRSGTTSTELLGFAAAGVSDEESLIVLDQEFLKLALGLFVVVLLVVRDDGLGNGHADGNDLGGGTATGDAHEHVHFLEAVGTEEEDGLEGLHPEGRGLEELKGLSVDVDESLSGAAVSNGGGVLFATEGLDLLGGFS